MVLYQKITIEAKKYDDMIYAFSVLKENNRIVSFFDCERETNLLLSKKPDEKPYKVFVRHVIYSRLTQRKKRRGVENYEMC